MWVHLEWDQTSDASGTPGTIPTMVEKGSHWVEGYSIEMDTPRVCRSSHEFALSMHREVSNL